MMSITVAFFVTGLLSFLIFYTVISFSGGEVEGLRSFLDYLEKSVNFPCQHSFTTREKCLLVYYGFVSLKYNGNIGTKL